MKENKVKNYSVRSARRRKAKNKSKAVKHARIVRRSASHTHSQPKNVSVVAPWIVKRRSTWAAYNIDLSFRRAISALAVRQIAMIEMNAIASKQLKALWADEVALAMATK